MVTKAISAAKFKAQCLALMDQVQARRTEIVITKRGKPVAKLVPVEGKPRKVFGCMAGTMKILGDIVEPAVDPSEWEVNQ